MVTSLIDQIIEPFADCMSPEAAQRVVTFRADEATQARLDSLADRANLGILTESEKADYDRLLAEIHFISLLQARARKLLKS
jgi:hypothetical protein